MNDFNPRLNTGEYLVELLRNGLKLIQSRQGYCFTMDAVLLAFFVTIKPQIRVADLGTGSGVIPLLLTTRTEGLSLVGFELQEELADRAWRSVQLNGLEKQIWIQKGDLRRISEYYVPETFEVVVCNPPYWPLGHGKMSPRAEVALAKVEITCTLTEVVQAGQWLLSPGGILALVHLWERREEVVMTLHKYGMKLYRWREVKHNQKMAPSLILVEAIKSTPESAAEINTPGAIDWEMDLKKMEPLVIYDLHGQFLPEVAAIYYG